MAQTLSGQNLRLYLQGSAVGFGRATTAKPDVSRGTDPVKQLGSDDVVEYVPKIKEATFAVDYSVINKKQLAVALGQAIGQLGNGIGEVPQWPDNIDVVERRIKPGTEGTTSEIYTGYSLYQKWMIEKDAYDEEVDKIVVRQLSGHCATPIDYEGNNGIQFDRFTGNGVQTAFVLTKYSIGRANGYLTIRAESPYQTFLTEGVDYTTASTSSTTTVTFGTAPASSTVNNVLVVYGW